MQVVGVAVDPTILVVHLPAPFLKLVEPWRREIGLLTETPGAGMTPTFPSDSYVPPILGYSCLVLGEVTGYRGVDRDAGPGSRRDNDLLQVAALRG